MVRFGAKRVFPPFLFYKKFKKNFWFTKKDVHWHCHNISRLSYGKIWGKKGGVFLLFYFTKIQKKFLVYKKK